MADKIDKKNYEIFAGKQLCDVFEDIYKNSNTKKDQIRTLINELRTLIKNLSDATIIVPLIAQYLEISVKNDEHLIKLAEIVQRLLKAERAGEEGAGGIGDLMTEEEQQKLLDKATNYTDLLREQAKKEAEQIVKLDEKREDL